jgi:hypothetical protein
VNPHPVGGGHIAFPGFIVGKARARHQRHA